MTDIVPGSNRARLLNVLWAADQACQEPTVLRLELLRAALDALPPGWEALVAEEVTE